MFVESAIEKKLSIVKQAQSFLVIEDCNNMKK